MIFVEIDYAFNNDLKDFWFVIFSEIQSWWEIPSIAHFCSLFKTAFDLSDFDIEVIFFSLYKIVCEL